MKPLLICVGPFLAAACTMGTPDFEARNAGVKLAAYTAPAVHGAKARRLKTAKKKTARHAIVPPMPRPAPARPAPEQTPPPPPVASEIPPPVEPAPVVLPPAPPAKAAKPAPKKKPKCFGRGWEGVLDWLRSC